MTREEQLRREYEAKLQELKKEQGECAHDWNGPVYDPEKVNIPQYKDRFIGSDYMPELSGFKVETIDRWSRTCKKCGKVEYTKTVVPTAVEPKF